MNEKEFIEDAEKSLQFVILLAIFFLTPLNALFNLSRSTPVELNETILLWSIIICSFVFEYIFFEVSKREINIKKLKLIKLINLSTIGLFMIVILVFPASLNKALPAYVLSYTLVVALYAIMIATVFNCGVILGIIQDRIIEKIIPKSS
jgi:hypothetical protein